MTFDYISIAYIVIFLVYVITGISKGFFKSLFELIKRLASFIIALFLVKPVFNLVITLDFYTQFLDKIALLFHEKGGVFTTLINAENKDLVLETVLTDLKIPSNISQAIVQMVGGYLDVNGETELSVVLASAILRYVSYSIIFFILYYLLIGIVSLFDKVFENIEKIPVLNGINKFFGLFIGAINGLIFILIVSYILALVVPFDNSISQWIVQTMQLDQPTKSISKFFYESNFLADIITYFQSFE